MDNGTNLPSSLPYRRKYFKKIDVRLFFEELEAYANRYLTHTTLLTPSCNGSRTEIGFWKTCLQCHWTKSKISRGQWNLMKSTKHHRLLDEELLKKQKINWGCWEVELPAGGTLTCDACFLLANRGTLTRQEPSSAPHHLNETAQCLPVYPKEGYTPLLLWGWQGEEKANHLLCMSVSQRTIFSACISRSRARLSTQSPPWSHPAFLPFLRHWSEIQAELVWFVPPCDKIKMGKKGAVGRKKNVEACLIPENISLAASSVRGMPQPPIHPQNFTCSCVRRIKILPNEYDEDRSEGEKGGKGKAQPFFSLLFLGIWKFLLTGTSSGGLGRGGDPPNASLGGGCCCCCSGAAETLLLRWLPLVMLRFGGPLSSAATAATSSASPPPLPSERPPFCVASSAAPALLLSAPRRPAPLFSGRCCCSSSISPPPEIAASAIRSYRRQASATTRAVSSSPASLPLPSAMRRPPPALPPRPLALWQPHRPLPAL